MTDSSRSTVEVAKRQLEDLLSFFGVNPEVSGSMGDDGVVELVVETDATGKLIGHRGETLRALQHLLNAMMKGKTDENTFISVDVAGYKKARAEQLIAKARKAAAEAIENGAEVALPPMPAGERRVVHAALGEIEGVRSESRGEEPRRRLVIVPESLS